MLQPIALIGGTGKSGPGLALRLALAGVPVLVGSRDPEKGRAAAERISAVVSGAGGGARVTGHSNEEAAERGALAFVTIPYEGQAATLPPLAGALAGTIVVSTAVPLEFVPGAGPRHVDVPEGSAAEQAAALLPGARVAAGFHSLSSSVLQDPARRIDSHVIVTGDDAEAKRVAMEAAELLPGVRAVDGGPLRMARYSEHLTVLLLSINRANRVHAGVVITDLPAR